jgi:hypothetical protein
MLPHASDDGQQWLKHVKAKILITPIKLASAEVKKMWIYTSIPPYAFMA